MPAMQISVMQILLSNTIQTTTVLANCRLSIMAFYIMKFVSKYQISLLTKLPAHEWDICGYQIGPTICSAGKAELS